MCSIGTRSAPPAPPPEAIDDSNGGGDGSIRLISMSREKRSAHASLWVWQYESQEAHLDDDDGYILDGDLARARHVRDWTGDLAPSGWFGMLPGRTLGAYVSDSLEALVLLRYQLDTSELKRALVGKQVLIVDEILLSPSIPDRLRAMVHAIVLQQLVALGAFHDMTVAFWEDFDI